MSRPAPLLPLAAIAAAILGATAAPAAEQALFVSRGPSAEAVVGSEQNWGTATDIVYTAYAHEFNLFQGVEAPMNQVTSARSCASGLCGWLGAFHLPTGAVIDRIEITACDNDGANGVEFALLAGPRAMGAIRFVAPFVITPGTPGCNRYMNTLAQPQTVQNGVEGYFLDVLAGPGNNVNWNQVRVIYRLQVSPGPAVASFGDVPTSHPAFRFVEALAASGITGGCGGGNYCPDAPLTRAQMAVFLATALGLHFPN